MDHRLTPPRGSVAQSGRFPGQLEEAEGGAGRVDHLVLTATVEQPDSGQIADRPINPINLAECCGPTAVEIKDQLVLGEGRRVQVQDADEGPSVARSRLRPRWTECHPRS